MENREQNEIEFDLLQMLSYLMKRVWIILLAMVVFAAASYVVSKRNQVPQYTASCRVFVNREGAGSNYNEQLYALYLRKDCEVILTGRNVAAQIVENLGIKVSPDVVSKKIIVAAADDTHVLELTYTDTNPKRAAAILNELCEVGAEELKRHITDASVTVMYYADVPVIPTGGTVVRDTVLGAAIGLVLAAAVLIVIFLLDDTIRSEDDVARYLGLSTLGAIPSSEELGAPRKAGEAANGKGVARFAKK